MKKNNSFENTSYGSHAGWYSGLYPDDEAKLKRINIWKQTDTVNNWLHQRHYAQLLPLLEKDSKWLTVGDGNGADASFLLSFDCDVVASDISDTLLPVAQKEGLIKKYSVENAEKFSFADNSFDYVLCKESFHHFPRPWIAFYEMLRVARKGIVVIEPQDPVQKMPLLLALCNIFDRISPDLMQRFWKNRYSFEEVGNFVFKISEREFEKAAMGVNLPAVAFKGINDHYIKGVENEKAVPSSKLFKKIKRKLAFKNLLSGLHLMPAGAVCAVVFKTLPDSKLKQRLTKDKFRYVEFPKNPYL